MKRRIVLRKSAFGEPVLAADDADKIRIYRRHLRLKCFVVLFATGFRPPVGFSRDAQHVDLDHIPLQPN